MIGFPTQQLRVLAGRLAVTHRPAAHGPPADLDWLALVRAPEGLTIVHTVTGTTSGESWVALYSDGAHALDLPGMLAGVVAPLGAAGVPVFVASTWHADLVLVPQDRLSDALAALRAAGHEVRDGSPG